MTRVARSAGGSATSAGPAVKQGAAKYKGKPEAVQNITAIIRKGSHATGGPHWGKATMPDSAERPEVSPAAARQLAALAISPVAPPAAHPAC